MTTSQNRAEPMRTLEKVINVERNWSYTGILTPEGWREMKPMYEMSFIGSMWMEQNVAEQIKRKVSH